MLRNIGKMLAALDVGRHLNALKISTSKLHPSSHVIHVVSLQG